MRIHDSLLGLITVAAGAAIVFGAQQLRAIPGQLYGSSFFPTLLGIVCIVVGLVMVVISRGSKTPLITLPSWISSPLPVVRALSCMAAVLFFILLAEKLGFLLSSIIIMLVLMRLLGTTWTVTLLSSVCASVVLHLIFAKVLKVPLPFGYLERLLS